MSGRGDVGALWNGNGEAQLLALAQPRGDGLFLSRTIGTAPLEDSGCNGAAGQVLLFLAAHRVYRDPVFLAASQGFGKFAGRGEGDLGSLCCGHAGVGFAMLSLFRATGFAPRAGRFPNSHPHSLFKGELGAALLAIELEHADDSAFPLLE